MISQSSAQRKANSQASNNDSLYLSAIQQLVHENQQVKQANNKQLTLIEDMLDSLVQLFRELYPSIPAYDNDCIYKAGQQICSYYKKQLYMCRVQIWSNFAQIMEIYGVKMRQKQTSIQNISQQHKNTSKYSRIHSESLDDGFDIGDYGTLDNYQQFFQAMRQGKNGLMEQMIFCQSRIQELQGIKAELQRTVNLKQLQVKRVCIDSIEKQSEIHRLTSSNQLLTLQVQKMTKQLARINDQCQSLQINNVQLQGQLNTCRSNTQDLRRQILYLQKQRGDKRFYTQDQRN